MLYYQTLVVEMTYAGLLTPTERRCGLHMDLHSYVYAGGLLNMLPRRKGGL
jgi:hypothetical protein